MGKGSSFERQIAKQLSLWWTDGQDDAVFWRSSQSGGRATQRAKSGKKTFGSYGDLTAVNPIGQPLLKLFTIELKRGRSHGCPNDLFDCRRTSKPKPFEETLNQTIRSAQQANTPYWLLISRRDGRESMAYFCGKARTYFPAAMAGPCLRFEMAICGQKAPVRFVGMRLVEFLDRVHPTEIIQVGKHRKCYI